MPWTCQTFDIVSVKLVECRDPARPGVIGETAFVLRDGRHLFFRELPVGAMFPIPDGADMTEWPWYLASDKRLSEHYFKNNAHRRALFVVLPGRVLFVIDGQCQKDGQSYGGWCVSGQAPLITVNPSINIHGAYHGFLQNGVISDDCEGRSFGPNGERP